MTYLWDKLFIPELGEILWYSSQNIQNNLPKKYKKNNITKQNSSEKNELNNGENTDELKKLKYNTQVNMKHKYNSQVISKQILGH